MQGEDGRSRAKIYLYNGKTKGLHIEVLEIDDAGNILKAKAVDPDPELGKIGFFQEGNDWVTFPLSIITKN